MNKKGENNDKASSSTSSIIWDCGSPLYDSYELVSLVHLIERNTMFLPVTEAGYSSPEPEIDVVKLRRCYSSKEGEKINSDGNKLGLELERINGSKVFLYHHDSRG
ncbi:hypothetical protein H5410_043840 [Solanum commersonii]|uniref:Uncharacterized protein n=1 Tax=Solanum commersonii TaxID=4109 RepID=A0A9J5Y2G6_SOLCO|nr:hypothetical protein H5410_043840 [Solanum commersonii]